MTDGMLTDVPPEPQQQTVIAELTKQLTAKSLEEEVVRETQVLTETMTAMIASFMSVELLAAMRKFKARVLQAQRTTSGTISLLSSASHLSLRRYIII
ncbi:hypothetical protein NP493_4709g00002 [Ridgeia piscesae]|uniref:Uncharacterized protein n=1 Tax=Ridgeia piscesae TaxID=27915 RepID=A0AAD9MSW3_RIDPI|nr:hypothetical protein NP493_4709g00002 [Ridgeia piscesae]